MDWKRISDEIELRTSSIMQNSFSTNNKSLLMSNLRQEPKIIRKLEEIEDRDYVIEKFKDGFLGKKTFIDKYLYFRLNFILNYYYIYIYIKMK